MDGRLGQIVLLFIGDNKYILTTDATNGRSRGKAGGKEHGIKDITEIPVLLEISILPLVRMIYI